MRKKNYKFPYKKSKNKYRLTPRMIGINPRALGTNPRALGINPHALGLTSEIYFNNPKEFIQNLKRVQSQGVSPDGTIKPGRTASGGPENCTGTSDCPKA